MGLFDFLQPKEQRVEHLWNRAMAELESLDFDGALKTARELERLRFTGAFEVEARALTGLERGEEAVAALERGLAMAPESGRLWEQLGIQCSDLGHWDRAHEALAKARVCTELPDLASAWFNDALAWSRQGEHARAGEALSLAPTTTDRELAAQIEGLRARCELALDRASDALARVDRWLASPAAEDSSLDPQTKSSLLATRAVALHATGVPRELVHAAIDAALALDKSVPDAAKLLRELDGRRSEQARHWKIMARGLWPAPSEDDLASSDEELVREEMGFFTTYFVIADTPENALELCRRFEPPHVRNSLCIESSNDLGPAKDQLLGVERARGGHTFFAESNES